jgi:hypothetical protein
MRKINLSSEVDTASFTSFNTCYNTITINDNNKLTKLPRVKYTPDPYNPAQRLRINQCNEILSTNNEPVLTKEEENYFLFPLGNKKTSTEELQALAGFSVDKKISYT